VGRGGVTAPGTILVVGDVIDDVVVRPLRAPAPDTDTPAEITACPGGSGANQAAWLGALGADVRFAGRTGARDAAGHAAALRASGVDARLAADPAAPTGQIVVLVRDGRRDMFTSRGANLNLTAADLPDTLLDGVALLHVSGYSLFHDGVRAAVTGLMARARRRGVALSVDPASAGFLRDTGAARFRTWTAPARLIFPNLAEGRLLTGARTPDGVADALTAAYDVVALKLGADGALVATADGTRLRLPPAPARVADPTGSGDAFCAGYLTAWISGAPPRACGDSALAAAARALATIGARP
jgi:sugar/nucleoside kinase (ribokinase family)